MKLLHLDIETAPHRVYAWGLWGQDIHPDNIVEPGYTLCWAAKWHGSREVLFESVHKSKPKTMIKRIHALMSEADALCHYNGSKFDIPILNQEFLFHGLAPPDPSESIDLLKTARSRFRLPSNKLDYVAKRLCVGGKVQHKGMELWRDCMDGDDSAWRVMERYNKQDVKLLERVYNALTPWIVHHPNLALYQDDNRPACTNCGSHHVQSRGTEKTRTQIYRRYKCMKCGTPLRGGKTIKPREKEVLRAI